MYLPPPPSSRVQNDWYFTCAYACTYASWERCTMSDGLWERHMSYTTVLSLATSRPPCNSLQLTATHCNTLQHTATHCNTLQLLQHHATHCNTLQFNATHCNTLQHTATPSRLTTRRLYDKATEEWNADSNHYVSAAFWSHLQSPVWVGPTDYHQIWEVLLV